MILSRKWRVEARGFADPAYYYAPTRSRARYLAARDLREYGWAKTMRDAFGLIERVVLA